MKVKKYLHFNIRRTEIGVLAPEFIRIKSGGIAYLLDSNHIPVCNIKGSGIASLTFGRIEYENFSYQLYASVDGKTLGIDTPDDFPLHFISGDYISRRLSDIEFSQSLIVYVFRTTWGTPKRKETFEVDIKLKDEVL